MSGWRALLVAVLLGGAGTLQAQAQAAAPALAPVFAHPLDAAALAPLLAPATRGLDAAQTVRGAFRQSKFLAGLPQPLVSEGDFLFIRDRGVAWRTHAPFASELLITPEALVQRGSGDDQRLEAATQPAVRTIAAVFLAVFALDFASLERLFVLHGLAADQGWVLGLTPRQLTGGIEAIEVRGTDEVRSVVLYEAGGDRTAIELLRTELSAAPPTPAEAARLAPR